MATRGDGSTVAPKAAPKVPARSWRGISTTAVL